MSVRENNSDRVIKSDFAEPPATEVLRLEHVSKTFGATMALDNVSMSVPEGVVFALLGENGAGKTTLIRILTGFTSADSGTVSVLGETEGRSTITLRRFIGYVSDSPPLYDWMKAEEIGWFTSAFYDNDYPSRYLELLAAFNIPTGVKLKKMSKGQRAKVALALATAHDPRLLILDEPTSGLDPMVRRQFLESMVDRAAQGRTVLLSSHHINEVERVANWVAILHEGKMKIVAPLEQLRSSTFNVTATLTDTHVAIAAPRGEVLSEIQSGRQVRWIVRNLPDNWQSDYSDDAGITSMHATSATLEEIFVAVCGDNQSTNRRNGQ